MATLWIREYSTLPTGLSGSGAQIAAEPGTDQAPVTFTTTTASAAFNKGTKYIGIISDSAFHYHVAVAPVATTNMLKVPAETLLFIGVPGEYKIAAVTAS